MTTRLAGTKSARIFEQGRLCIPGGINSFSRALDPPRVFTRASGAYVYDADDNPYLDYHAAFGPILLGHCHPAVNRAVIESLEKLDLVGIGSSEFEIRLAMKLTEHVPSAELVQLCNTGTEATYNAVRLARAVTGKMKLLKFQGCFHGTHDYLNLNVISRAERLGARDPGSAGMLPEAVEHTLVAEFNDLSQVEEIVGREGGGLAAIILEPVPHNIGCVLPCPGFLEGLRRIATEHGIVLIFDEVISGFRHGLGGYQKVSGVTPDLTTLGKSIANGFPCAALCGKREMMQRLSTAGGDTAFAGTYNGHPASSSAALATIDILENTDALPYIFDLGATLRRELQDLILRLGVEAHVAGFGSVFTIYFQEPPVRSYTDLLRNNTELDRAFRREMLDSGILVHPTPLKRNHISLSHTEDDLARTVDAVSSCLRRLIH